MLFRSKAEIDVFLELSCFFHDPVDVGNLISGSSDFCKTSLNIRKFTVHVLLKLGFQQVLLHSPVSVLQQHFPIPIVELLGIKLVLEKAEEPEIKLPTSAGLSKKQESSRKTSISALVTVPKPLTMWITKNCGKL